MGVPLGISPSLRYIVLSAVFELRHSATGVAGMAQLVKALQARVGGTYWRERYPYRSTKADTYREGHAEDPSRCGNPWMKGDKGYETVMRIRLMGYIDYDCWSCGSFCQSCYHPCP